MTMPAQSPDSTEIVVVDGTAYRLGRKRPIGVSVVAALRGYIDFVQLTATPPPVSVDWSAKAQASIKRTYLNDRYGDCHSADTEVLTDKGWIGWPDYDSQLLGTMNRSTGLLEFQAPTGIKRRKHDGPMVFGTHKGQDFAVTPNHRFYHRPYVIPYPYVAGKSGYGDFAFAEADNLPHRCLIPGATSGFIGIQLDKLTIGNRQWDGTDFLRLLALILSDGYVSGGTTNRQRSGFCCFREDRINTIRTFADRLGIREEKSRPGVWVLSDSPLADWLRANIYVGDDLHAPFKRIPELVKVASQSQIEEFLRYFGDQSFSTGSRQFFTSSPRMADDLQELLLRIGKRASLYERGPRPGHEIGDGKWIESKRPSFTLHEWQNSDVSLLRAGKKPSIEFDHYKGEVFCAEVPNSTLVTRRNGSILISGNCVIAGKAHAIGIWTANESGSPVLVTDNTIYQTYQKWCGPGDNGCNIEHVLRQMQRDGFPMDAGGAHKLDGYAAVDWSNKLEVQVALYLFGALCIGIQLPSAWTGGGDGSIWDVTNTQIVGGHDVTCVGYNDQGVQIATWGGLRTITWAAFQSKTWLEECWAMLAPDWYAVANQTPVPGLDLAALQADLKAIANGQMPTIPPITIDWSDIWPTRP